MADGKNFFNASRLLLFLKGMAMGAADTVPGISGGTIAFIANIYEELIFSIQSCNLQALRVLRRQGLQAAWVFINGNFLLTLFCGILSAAFILANIVGFLLDNFEVYVMAFFIGLILASSLFLRKHVSKWNWLSGFCLLAGVLFAVSLNLLPARENDAGLWFMFVCGAIAICAMILPGISGAFILVLLGAYEKILDAVRELDFSVLLLFMGGCVVGLISFSNILAYLLKHQRTQTLAFLLGILLGSLYTIWPDQLLSRSVGMGFWLKFVALVSAGFILVYYLEKLSETANQNK